MWSTSHSASFKYKSAHDVLTIHSGRRPLSALGVIHIFQRRALVRQWNEDFPALHSEGGLPGSASAGIVAFIRERLVDVGNDSGFIQAHHNDAEAQTGAEAGGSHGSSPNLDEGTIGEGNKMLDHAPNASLTSRECGFMLDAGYLLEEVSISLMDMDLGLGGGAHNQESRME